MDIIKELLGEYTVLTLTLVVLNVFLNRFIPPIKEQWKFLILACTGMVLAFFMPPNDWQCLLYGFIIAGLVTYKSILVEEIKLVLKASKHVEENKESQLTNNVNNDKIN